MLLTFLSQWTKANPKQPSEAVTLWVAICYLSVPFHQGSLTAKTSNQASPQVSDQTVFAGIMETEIKAVFSLLFFPSVFVKRLCQDHLSSVLVPHGGARATLPSVVSAAWVFPLLPSVIWE